MSYVPTGATSPAPRPGFVWVEATATVPAHWERARTNGVSSTGRKVVAVRHTPTSAMTPEQLAERRKRFAPILARRRHERKCKDTGMPPELVPACVERLLAGEKFDDVMKAMEAEFAALQAQPAPSAAPSEGRTAAPRSRILLYGGAVVAAGAAYWLFFRRKS